MIPRLIPVRYRVASRDAGPGAEGVSFSRRSPVVIRSDRISNGRGSSAVAPLYGFRTARLFVPCMYEPWGGAARLLLGSKRALASPPPSAAATAN